MPSDFTPLVCGELDLNCPTPSSATGVLHRPGAVHLQTPGQQLLKVMSQKSGGVARSPTSAALPSGSSL